MAKNCQLCGNRMGLFGNDKIIGLDICSDCKEDVAVLSKFATTGDSESYLNSFDKFEQKHINDVGFEMVKGAICRFYDACIEMRLNSGQGKTLEEINEEKIKEEEKRRKEAGVVYYVEGDRGRCLEVYEDKCIITVIPTIGSLITGNATDGQKTIYFKDVIGIQYKKSGITLGYLQLETASGSMNNKHSNFFNENSFTFGENTSNEVMMPIVEYIKERVDAYKKNDFAGVKSFSAADELKKFKELLDMGIISQEEFDAKKKQLLCL